MSDDLKQPHNKTGGEEFEALHSSREEKTSSKAFVPETGCDGEEDAGPLKEAVDSSNKGKFWDQKAADKGKASHRGQLPDYGKPRQCKDCNVNQWFSTVYCSEDSNTCCYYVWLMLLYKINLCGDMACYLVCVKKDAAVVTPLCCYIVTKSGWHCEDMVTWLYYVR